MCSTLIASLIGTPAGAFTFTLVNGSTDQLMTWRVGAASSTLFSINSEIPLFIGGSGGNKAGGMLDWTASSGKLKVVAMPVSWTSRSSLGGPSDSWSSIDARTPPTFMLIPESEPIPFTVDLLIRVRIVGTLERFTGPSGEALTVIHMSQAVDYNGVTVTSDALDYENTISGGASAVGPVSFPKGLANNVVLHGVPNGSFFTIPIWAYMRGIVTNVGSVDGYGSYGDGLAVEIELSDANAVAVEDEPLTAPLSLAAGPNPGRGPTQVSYRLPRASQVRLSIYDVAGHSVARLVDGWQEAGRHEASWNGKTTAGEPIVAGVYFMELTSGSERKVQKLVRLGR